ncbi:MAG: (d)CMP kinase [Defluviitaleaceae bacterium]|nr:(d)CMP kinase [Defluviitaleaceae bacterium]
MNNIQIAIDGPTGSGKSTVAKMLAKKLGFIYLDTGAMYRAVSLYFIRKNIDFQNENKIKEELQHIEISIQHKDNVQYIFLNNEDVTEKIRENEVSKITSKISVYKSIREKLVFLQKNLAKNKNIVMDGRDIGTVVLPNASLKIFLIADIDIRIKRRETELLEKGQKIDFQDLKKEIIERDERDSKRNITPLMKAKDAILIDSTNLTTIEVVEKIEKLINIKNQ